MSHTIIETTRVLKNIDPIDKSAYKMKQMYEEKRNKKVKKPNIGSAVKMYEALKGQSLFPSVFNKRYLLGNM